MDVEIAKLWIAKHHEGYKQGFEYLRDNKDKFDSLGLLCEVFKDVYKQGKWEYSHDYCKYLFVVGDEKALVLPPSCVDKAFGVSPSYFVDIIEASDTLKENFNQLADRIYIKFVKGKV